MPTTDELTVVLRTVADTTGAEQVRRSLQQTQQAGVQLSTQLTN